jgi:IS66 C-terminal element
VNNLPGGALFAVVSPDPAPRAGATGNELQLPARHGQNERVIALGRRNWLFAGSHSGGERTAAMYSILQTAKLNRVNPEAYLTDTLAKIAAGHPINRISELMPWVYRSTHEAAA